MAAIIYLDDGTDATQTLSLWSSSSGTVTSDATNSVTGPRSVKCDSTGSNLAAFVVRAGCLADAGRRISFWFYMSAWPATTPHIMSVCTTGTASTIISVDVNSAGKLCLETTANTFVGTTVLSTNTWYRVTLSYTITSTTVNSFRVFLGNSSTPEHTQTNITLPSIASADMRIGMVQAFGATKQVWVDSVYIDDGTTLDNPGDIRVTYKSYTGTSEGTGFNDWDTFVGTTRATGSRYLNVSERPPSDSNAWEQAGTSQVYEKYLIQNAATGDVDLTGATIIGWMSWIRAKSSASASVASHTDNDVDATISTTTTITQYIHATTSATYPTGRFGMRSTGTATDTFFYEGGVLVAFTPAAAPTVLALAATGVG